MNTARPLARYAQRAPTKLIDLRAPNMLAVTNLPTASALAVLLHDAGVPVLVHQLGQHHTCLLMPRADRRPIVEVVANVAEAAERQRHRARRDERAAWTGALRTAQKCAEYLKEQRHEHIAG